MSELKKITKEQEIEMLTKLMESSSYLRDSLGAFGISKMIQNIKNDLPIEIEVFRTYENHDEIVNTYKKMIDKKQEDIEAVLVESSRILDEFNEFKSEILAEILSDEYIDKVNFSIRYVKENYAVEDIVFTRIKQGIPVNDNPEDMEIVENAISLLRDKKKSRRSCTSHSSY